MLNLCLNNHLCVQAVSICTSDDLAAATENESAIAEGINNLYLHYNM